MCCKAYCDNPGNKVVLEEKGEKADGNSNQFSKLPDTAANVPYYSPQIPCITCVQRPRLINNMGCQSKWVWRSL